MSKESAYNTVLAKEVADFFITEGDGLFTDEQYFTLVDAVIGHIKFSTIKILRDEDGIAACARWNWSGDDSIYVMDVAVREDCRKNDLVRQLASMCLKENPGCKFITFHNKEMNKIFKMNSEWYKKEEKS